MSTIDIPVDADAPTAAQIDSAPFPEATAIPTAHVELDEPDGKPDAFGDDSSAAPYGVKDAILEEPTGGDVPVTYVEAAQSLGNNDAGNEFNGSVYANDWHKANSTNAETLSSEPVVDEPKKQHRGRRTKAQIEADKASSLNK